MLDEAAYFLLGNIKIYYYGLHIALGALATVIVLALCCRARRICAEDFALLHYHSPIGQRERFFQTVFAQDHRCAKLRIDFFQRG